MAGGLSQYLPVLMGKTGAVPLLTHGSYNKDTAVKRAAALVIGSGSPWVVMEIASSAKLKPREVWPRTPALYQWGFLGPAETVLEDCLKAAIEVHEKDTPK